MLQRLLFIVVFAIAACTLTAVWPGLSPRSPGVPRLGFADSAPGTPSDLFTDAVAPLLRQRCASCHNPDKKRGGLDLSTRARMLAGGDMGAVVKPGAAADSLLMQMVSGADAKMPKQGPKLTPDEIASLRRWIDSGAPWPKDVTVAEDKSAADDWWSLRPLTRPAVPAVEDVAWVRTPIDAFVLAAMEQKGLHPSPPADRATLLRRVTFDLVGLPPTPDEIDAFLKDDAPDAYAKVVDRLLASPRYGERWARHWLDVAHYADTHGYDKDKRRDQAWPYRDYVIRAFNQDKPYKRFIQEQLAGDVLYPDDPDGVVATGFIVAGPWDFVGHVELREGTVDKEKTRVLDRDDMVINAVSTFDSMTVHCARCHDHKFDPIPQKDYYRLQAVFAGVERGDRPYANKDLARRTDLETRQRQVAAERAELLAKAAAVTSPDLVRLDDDLKKARDELAALPLPAGAPSPSNGWHSGISATPDVEKWVQVDLGKSVAIDAVRLVPARPTDFPDAPGFGFPVRFHVDASDDPTFAKPACIADQTKEDYANPGDAPVVFKPADVKARYVRVTAQQLWKRTGDYVFALAELEVDSEGTNVARGATVTSLDSIEAGRWSRRYLVDGNDSRSALPDLSDSKTAGLVKRRTQLQEIIQQKDRDRTATADALLDAATRDGLARTAADLAAVEHDLQELAKGDVVFAATPIPRRPIWVLHRGDVEQKKERVTPGALSCVKELDPDFKDLKENDEGARRAALAGWIADDRNPLTWRSIVNRVWHYHFGRGIVDTPSDFGRNGSRPTQTELLDWLAVEFRDGGGSFKKLHRMIVLSSAYRQSSANDADAAKIDADDRYLWRMTRQRLDAEEVRDAVLAVSGKLDLTMGGPAFELFRFKDDHSPVYDHTAVDKINDPANWRRTVYRFTVRSVPNPFLECLDCADPNVNTPVRNTTLTALQALALLNDPFMLKQAECFAERLEKSSDDPARQADAAYRLAFGRPPTAEERDALVEYTKKHGLAKACRVLFNANEFAFID
jgi:mono/diheme cytochrome c family protein